MIHLPKEMFPLSHLLQMMKAQFKIIKVMMIWGTCMFRFISNNSSFIKFNNNCMVGFLYQRGFLVCPSFVCLLWCFVIVNYFSMLPTCPSAPFYQFIQNKIRYEGEVIKNFMDWHCQILVAKSILRIFPLAIITSLTSTRF